MLRITHQPGSSVFHRLHPVVKGAWLIAGTCLVFVVRSPWFVLGFVALLLLVFRLSGLPLGKVRGTRLILTTALLLATLQVAFVRQGPALVEVGPLRLTQGGIEAAAYIAGRFASVVLLSYLYVLTTDPNELVYGLMQAGVPYRYGFALITALRLVPVFEQEGRIVYNAQLARGVRYDTHSPRRFLTLARQFTMPLLVSALSKVDALAVSMEGRCFGKYSTRTYRTRVQMTWLDWVALGGLLLVVLATVGYWLVST
jgi:energy-coupling factor transport system permease protein